MQKKGVVFFWLFCCFFLLRAFHFRNTVFLAHTRAFERRIGMSPWPAALRSKKKTQKMKIWKKNPNFHVA
jgi:hypothetical protein